MDFVKFSLAGFDDFLIYFGLSVVFVMPSSRSTCASRPTASSR